MAIVQTNYLVQGIRGKIGNGLILRTIRGKVVASSKPQKTAPQSTLQKENRHRFRLATAYAKAMMLDPEKKSFYQHKAKKLKLPNAYTAAITDYMRKPSIEVDMNNYKGEAGRTIKIKTSRRGFRVSSVKVFVKDFEGNILEEGQATDKNFTEEWVYKTVNTIDANIPFTLVVVVSYANILLTKEIS
jgi:hypothetical protein